MQSAPPWRNVCHLKRSNIRYVSLKSSSYSSLAILALCQHLSGLKNCFKQQNKYKYKDKIDKYNLILRPAWGGSVRVLGRGFRQRSQVGTVGQIAPRRWRYMMMMVVVMGMKMMMMMGTHYHKKIRGTAIIWGKMEKGKKSFEKSLLSRSLVRSDRRLKMDRILYRM